MYFNTLKDSGIIASRIRRETPNKGSLNANTTRPEHVQVGESYSVGGTGYLRRFHPWTESLKILVTCDFRVVVIRQEFRTVGTHEFHCNVLISAGETSVPCSLNGGDLQR